MSKQTIELSYLVIFIILTVGVFNLLDAFFSSTVAFAIFVPYGFALVWVMGKFHKPFYEMMNKRFNR